MIYLLLSILSSTIILLIFKWIEKLKVNLLIPIVFNYLSASVLGFVLSNDNPINLIENSPIWLYLSLIIGIMLIANFYLIGLSTQKAGMAITTIAAKMSFVLPVFFSLLYDKNDIISFEKAIHLLLALVAVLLMVNKTKEEKKILFVYLLPILIFFGLGILDALIKYCQYHYIHTPSESSIFSAANFSVSAIIGLIILVTNKKLRKDILKPKVVLLGATLGIANFGSMYFLINALNVLKYENSLVFGINNIGIVAVSVIIALVFFKERLTKLNYLGIILAIIVLGGMLVRVQ